jgi:hypothetical protein
MTHPPMGFFGTNTGGPHDEAVVGGLRTVGLQNLRLDPYGTRMHKHPASSLELVSHEVARQLVVEGLRPRRVGNQFRTGPSARCRSRHTISTSPNVQHQWFVECRGVIDACVAGDFYMALGSDVCGGLGVRAQRVAMSDAGVRVRRSSSVPLRTMRKARTSTALSPASRWMRSIIGGETVLIGSLRFSGGTGSHRGGDLCRRWVRGGA